MNTVIARITRPPFLLFVALGFLVSIIIFELLLNWIQVLSVLYGRPNLGYHELPTFIHYIQWTLRPLPWVIVVAVFAIDLVRRNFTRSLGYVTGVIIAMVTAVFIEVIQFVFLSSNLD